MHIVHFNLVFEPLASGRALVERYATMSTLAARQAAAGAQVTVLQRYTRDESLLLEGARYELRREPGPRATGRPWMLAPRLTRLARSLKPDVVHLHGLWFVVQARTLRMLLPSRTAVVVQDHATKPWDSRVFRSMRRSLLAAADGILLNATEMAEPLREAGVLPASVPCFAVREASSTMRRVDQPAARARVGLNGDPLVLWVGRLLPIKDPVTAVEGFCRAAPQHPGARLALIYHDDRLRSDVHATIARHGLSDRVAFIGRVPHADLVHYYSAADVFLAAGRWEGSNYSLIEAMACGVWPVCSSNPSHRGMLGAVGELFAIGDPESCRRALGAAMTATAEERTRRVVLVQQQFDTALSWDAVVEQTFKAYSALTR